MALTSVVTAKGQRSQDETLRRAGEKLRHARKRLSLTTRNVEDRSARLAALHQNEEYKLYPSRLSDIENGRTVPSIYRLYSLCTIYRLDIGDVLEWYDIRLGDMPAEAASLELSKTNLLGFKPNGHGEVKLPLTDPTIDFSRTTFLSRMIRKWGSLPVSLLGALDPQKYRYAFIGCDDWFMYPLIAPGALVMIDETRNKIVSEGWSTEFERPIYFLEHHEGFAFGWCSVADGRLLLQPHPASQCSMRVFQLTPERAEVDVMGQIVGVAMNLDQRRRRVRA